MSGWSLDVTGVPVGRKVFCLRSGPTRTRVVYATRSVKRSGAIRLGPVPTERKPQVQQPLQFLGCVLLLLHLGLSDGVRGATLPFSLGDLRLGSAMPPCSGSFRHDRLD